MLVWLLGEAEGNGPDGGTQPHCTEACCTGKGRQSVLRRALEYGFVVLPRDIGAALLLGVVIAGVIGVVVPRHGWEAYLGRGILSIVAMMALGVPLYVCASASVPIAAGLIHMGASPGAALAFLISGPASNPATITTVWKLLGRRTTALYLLAVVISAIGGGLTLDWLMPALGATLPPLGAHVHEAAGTDWLAASSAIVLLLVVAHSYAGGRRRSRTRRDGPCRSGGPPSSTDAGLAISGMTCNHCVAAVTRALGQCRGVASVQVDLAAGRAVVAANNSETSPSDSRGISRVSSEHCCVAAASTPCHRLCYNGPS